jgi:hypothetical protein
MSGYLMRLATRGRQSSEMQSMQPFVRTSSPVAEHDQRIGMRGSFEGFEPSEASFAEVGSEVGAEQGDVLQPPASPSVMTVSETGRVTVQRKMASPPAATAGPATPNARAFTGRFFDRESLKQETWMPAYAGMTGRREAHRFRHSRESGNPESQERQGLEKKPTLMSNAWGVAAATNTQMQARVQSPSSGAGAPNLTDAYDVPVSSSAPPMRSPASSTGGIHPEALGLGDSQTGSTSHRFDPGAVHTRSLRQTQQVDSTRLEPSPDALAEHFKPPLERASEPSADANEGPRVVIGRINVEVVPPPAVQPSTAASRSGPLTAASVSVIGPLGGGIRPSQRLSLRY